jgi:hypothetical protein
MEPREVKYQCSLYADDVILFIKPSVQEATAVKEILRVFGEATDLKTNLAKCYVTPIYGGEDTIDEIVTILGCQVQQFPIKYLGLPLSKKIPKAEYHSLVEAVARKMPTCHGSLMARSGHLIWIKSVLWAMPIYSMMADSLPPWVRKEIDSICRRFLWVGKDASVRSKFLVVWAIACRPMEFGGLGITDLKLVGYALQTRWLWLRKTGLLQGVNIHSHRRRPERKVLGRPLERGRRTIKHHPKFGAAGAQKNQKTPHHAPWAIS